MYYFTRQPPLDAPIKGAAHDAELYYVFHNLNLFPQQWASWDRQLEDMISSYWVNFADHGDPNGRSLPRWTAFSKEEQDRVMIFGDKVEMGASRLDTAKAEFLEKVSARRTR